MTDAADTTEVAPSRAAEPADDAWPRSARSSTSPLPTAASRRLVAAVTAADLVETLSGDGPFTVFAPTDDAFAALPEGLVDALLLPENKDALAKILTYHVVAGRGDGR